jgi:hypothetical protein
MDEDEFNREIERLRQEQRAMGAEPHHGQFIRRRLESGMSHTQAARAWDKTWRAYEARLRMNAERNVRNRGK